jgi:hypothetical protein
MSDLMAGAPPAADMGGDAGTDAGAPDAGGEGYDPTADPTNDAWTGTGTTPTEGEADVDPDEEGEDREPEASADEDDPDDEGQPLTAGQAKKLRAEAASLRARAGEYEDAFAKVHPDDRQIMLDAARLLADDPKAWAEQMAPLVEAARRGGGDEPDEQDAPGDDKAPMSRADLDAWYAERKASEDRERQEAERQERGRQAVRNELTELGYKPDAEKGTAEGRRTLMVQALALNEFDGDIKKAHEALEADRRSSVKAVVDTKRAQRDGSPPVTNGTAGAEAKKPPAYGTPAWRRSFDQG